MLDVVSVIIGALLVILIITITLLLLPKSGSSDPLKDPTVESGYDNLQNTPHCPFCQSYDLTLIDDNAGVPWLKGKISDLDHYRCNKCLETFSDEDWQEGKSYEGRQSNDD